MSERGATYITSLAEAHGIPAPQGVLFTGEPIPLVLDSSISFRSPSMSAQDLFHTNLNIALAPLTDLQHAIAQKISGRTTFAPPPEDRGRRIIAALKPSNRVTGHLQNFAIELSCPEELTFPPRPRTDANVLAPTDLRLFMTAHARSVGAVACGLRVAIAARPNTSDLTPRYDARRLPRSVKTADDLATLHRRSQH